MRPDTKQKKAGSGSGWSDSYGSGSGDDGSDSDGSGFVEDSAPVTDGSGSGDAGLGSDGSGFVEDIAHRIQMVQSPKECEKRIIRRGD